MKLKVGRGCRADYRAVALTSMLGILLVVVMIDFSDATAQAEGYGRGNGPVTTEELMHTRPADMFSLAEDHAPAICQPLLESLNRRLEGLNRPLENPMESRLYPFIRNDYLIQPWKDRRFLLRPNDDADPAVNYWEAAFLDLNDDGVEDALFRDTNSIRGNEFNSTYLMLSVDPEVKAEEPLSEIRARQIIRNNYLTYERFDESPHDDRQFVELAQMSGRVFVLNGRSLFWALDELPRKPKLQLLSFKGSHLERVCLFNGVREIRLSR